MIARSHTKNAHISRTQRAASLACLLEVTARCPSIRPATLLEIVGFCMGAKPTLRLTLNDYDADRFRVACTASGIPIAERRVYLVPHGGTWTQIVQHETERSSMLVTVATTLSSARQLLRMELDDAEGAGRLLGYPPCCLAAFPRLVEAGPQWPFLLLKTAASPTSHVNMRCNRFAADWGGTGLIGELFPCSLQCAAAAAYADRLLLAAQKAGLLRLCQRVESDSLTPVEILVDGTITAHCEGFGQRVEFAA